MGSAHSPIFPSPHPRHSSSPTLSSLYLRHSSFSTPYFAIILQPFHCFTYITAHSPTLPSLQLHHSSFSNPSIVLPTSQLILQHFRCFTYVTTHSPTLHLFLLRHRLFIYVTWRAAHGLQCSRDVRGGQEEHFYAPKIL